MVALQSADLLEKLIVQRHVGCVCCIGLVDSAVRGGRVFGNSSIVFRDRVSVRATGAVIAAGRSISSVTAIGGRGFVGLLQGLLELLGLLVIFGFCGVGFADSGRGVGGTAQRFRSGDFRLMKFGKLVEIVRLVKTGERFGDFCLQLERLRIGGVHGRDGFLTVVQRGQVTHLLRCAYACESEDRTQNDNHDDYGDNDLAIEALYMLVRPIVAIADALRYGRVERVLRSTGFVGFNGCVCFERLPIAGLSRVATDDCACFGCVGVDRVDAGFGCVSFIGSAVGMRISGTAVGITGGVVIGIAGKCAVDGRAVGCAAAGSGVSTVGRSVGRCASGKCSRCA